MDIEEVRTLVGHATSALNKADAKSYIQSLRLLRLGGVPNEMLAPYADKAFGDLVASVERASGQVKEKYRLLSFVDRDLYKLEGLLRDKVNPSDQSK